jgi:hypothetical protein
MSECLPASPSPPSADVRAIPDAPCAPDAPYVPDAPCAPDASVRASPDARCVPDASVRASVTSNLALSMLDAGLVLF